MDVSGGGGNGMRLVDADCTKSHLLWGLPMTDDNPTH